jgi:hypothetical protein
MPTIVAGLALVEPHGSMRTPLARTAVQTLPNHGGAQQPFWWDLHGVWCGNQQQNVNVTNCGRCGDAPGNSHAARGGRYDKAIITGTYTAGQQIDVVVDMNANHRGQMWWELCTINDGENDSCFQRLNIVRGDREVRGGNVMCSGFDHQNGLVGARIQLPANFRCTRCTLRWTYRTSYPPAPDACFNPNPAQTFRNCVDIRIN